MKIIGILLMCVGVIGGIITIVRGNIAGGIIGGAILIGAGIYQYKKALLK